MGNMGDHNYSCSGLSPAIHKKNPSIQRTYSRNPSILRQRLKDTAKKSESPMCPMCREIFTLIDSRLVLQRSSSTSLACPFACSSHFPIPEALTYHIKSVHLSCSCSGRPPHVQEKEADLTITNPSSRSLRLRPSNYFHHITPQELTPKLPNYLNNLSSNILSPFGLCRTRKPSNNSTVNCIICAIKFTTVKDYLDHMKKYHKTVINLPKRARKIRREELDEEPDSFGIWSLDGSSKPKRSRGEDFNVAAAEYLRDLEKEEETPSTSNRTAEGKSNPRIIAESQNFDPVMKEYLEKLRRDHRSLALALSSMKSRSLEDSERIGTPEIFDFDEETFQEKRKCPRCGKLFHSMKELAEHFNFVEELVEEENGGMISWKCAQCDKAFRSLQVLICHRYFIHDDESMVHICNNCCKILTSTTMVNTHECENQRFRCAECKEKFQGSKELLHHNQKRHLEKPGPHNCPICKKKFLTKSMMRRHTVKCKCQPEDRQGNTLHQCRKCKIFWKTPKELLQHIKKTHSLDLCRLCNADYKIGKFIEHVRTSHLKNRVLSKIIEADADIFVEFIKTIGQEHLMSLVQYVGCDRIEHKLICQICCDDFKSELNYRIHNAKFHDLFCVLCNRKFEDANCAFEHKNKCHGSIYRYIWFAEEIMQVLIGTEAFSNMKQGFLEAQTIFDDPDQQLEINELNANGFINGNVEISEKESNERDFFLIITDEDMEKYRDNVPQFARKISESCNFIPIEDIEVMLRHWVFN